MPNYRIDSHPILPIPAWSDVEFIWQGKKLTARQGETIAAALFASGEHTFGHHPKDGSPQGIFCANGQCAQCLVIANDKPVKACMELIEQGMDIKPVDGLPSLPAIQEDLSFKPIRSLDIPVLIIGGGPAGLSAAIELAQSGVRILLIDDKHQLGGKLVLQTHRFFGSRKAVYAGIRGIDIAHRLEDQVRRYSNVEIWLHSTALAVFSDQRVGILKDGCEYVLVKPEAILTATGAREKFLAFKGNILPGVYGAGAFQTILNRDLVRPSERLFIVGGGNVGLITGYHALQAGIQVVGLAEALPECGGYKVHRDKLARLGVPIYTSHTILSANGKDHVESVTIARVDEKLIPVPGTEQSFECDTVLIAIGLDPINEFYRKAISYGLSAFCAGDAAEIAEASAAIFSGKITGREIARQMGFSTPEIPPDWYILKEILKSKPGHITREIPLDFKDGVFPMIHCTQEIPCDPCAALCPQKLININPQDIRNTPVFIGSAHSCRGCERCVIGCPGLAITLVDYRQDQDFPLVSIPFEFSKDTLNGHQKISASDTGGNLLGEFDIVAIQSSRSNDRTLIIKVKVPKEIALKIAGVYLPNMPAIQALPQPVPHLSDDTIICRCERVSARDIQTLICQGLRDINEIKTITRAGMGACGSKTCSILLHRLFHEEGIPDSEITDPPIRPLFVEVPLGIFANSTRKRET